MASTSPEIQHNNGYRKNALNPSQTYDISPADALYAWWDSFAKGIIGLTTLGASITFSVILSELPDPIAIRSTHPSKLSRKIAFDKETVRKFLSVAWLMFVLALGLAMVSLVQLKKKRRAGDGMKVLELVLEWLVLAAFMFLALAVSAYVPEVGVAGVAFIAFFALLAFTMWLGSCGS